MFPQRRVRYTSFPLSLLKTKISHTHSLILSLLKTIFSHTHSLILSLLPSLSQVYPAMSILRLSAHWERVGLVGADPRLPGVVSDAYNNEGKVGKIEVRG